MANNRPPKIKQFNNASLAEVAAAMARAGYSESRALASTRRALRGNSDIWHVLEKIRGSRGRTSLMYAAYKGDLGRARMILDKNSSNIMTKTDDIGGSLMHYAAIGGHVEFIHFLHSKGHPIDSKDSEGNTPLMFASLFKKLPAIKALCDLGAEVDHTNIHGETALFGTVFSKDPDDLPPEYKNLGDFTEENTKIIDELLKRGAEINHQNNARRTLLMIASILESPNALNFLLSKRPNLELKNSYGQTALQYAAGEGSVQAVSILCEADADVNTRDNDQSTPLITTVNSLHDVRSKPLGLVKEIIQTLLEHGAVPTLTDIRGRTFIDCATEETKEEIQAILDSVHSEINSIAGGAPAGGAGGGASRKRKARKTIKTRKAKRKTRKARS